MSETAAGSARAAVELENDDCVLDGGGNGDNDGGGLGIGDGEALGGGGGGGGGEDGAGLGWGGGGEGLGGGYGAYAIPPSSYSQKSHAWQSHRMQWWRPGWHQFEQNL